MNGYYPHDMDIDVLDDESSTMSSLQSVRKVVQSKLAWIGSLTAMIKVLVVKIASFLHRWLGVMVAKPVAWETLWSSVPYCEDVTVVMRVETSFLVDTRVEGFLQLQKYGRVFRFAMDGHTVLTDEDGISSKGQRFYGCVYLPDAVPWGFETKKVKSTRSDIRGRCSRLSFPRNSTGVTSVQVTVLKKGTTSSFKTAIKAFEDAMHSAVSSS